VAARREERAVLSAAAFGFRLAGAPAGGWFALDGADLWPVLTLIRADDVALEHEARVDWGRMYAAVCAQLPEDELVHPVLGRMLPLLAEARGIDALHGGLLLGADGAWAVLGARESGKSSLLAQCHRLGAQVASDDIIVLEGNHCLAGPRCIDLREEPARRLGPGTPVRGRSKQRILLPPAPAETELAGVIHLGWGSALELVPLPPSERLARLATQRAQEGWPRDRVQVLDLAALPTFELRRPRDLGSLRDSAELLIEHLGGALTPSEAACRA
jgi:hypothetical protein